MLNALTNHIWLALRRIAGDLRGIASAVLVPRNPDHLRALWRRSVVLQPVRVRLRRDADRF